MDLATSNLKIVLILTIGFAFASIFGYITQRLKISPILGYLFAGFLIGPYSPGFVADITIADQLAEIGVILMMFGVGVHFKWDDMVSVKNIAIPGAIGQTLVAATLGAVLVYLIGWSWSSGIVIGLAIGVASTVVLLKILIENNLINTPQGHIAVGWLIVEDILTVAALILLPTLAGSFQESFSMQTFAMSIISLLFKFILLAALMFTVGHKLVEYVLVLIARTRSHELFTLTMLALIFLIATGSALFFGTSIALGAFIAGMVIGQTHVRHQASANALPMQDTFVVIFFLTVGMLFNPSAILEEFPLFLGILTIILCAKPLAAFLIVWIYRYPIKTALTVALALAQIGEFSFILSEEAMKLNILPDTGFDIIVACAIISISINPILFHCIDPIIRFLEKKKIIGVAYQDKEIIKTPGVVIVGYGPIGKGAAQTLRELGFSPIIIDRNVDTIGNLLEKDQQALFGDAITPEILENAQIKDAKLLLITIPDMEPALNIIASAKQLNPHIKIILRVRFTNDKHLVKDHHIKVVCCEDEALKALNDHLNTHLTEWSIV